MRKGPVEHGVGHARHILGAGEQDGCFNHTHFPYLLGVSDFTKPIESVNTGDDFLLEDIARVQHNGRHPLAAPTPSSSKSFHTTTRGVRREGWLLTKIWRRCQVWPDHYRDQIAFSGIGRPDISLVS